MLEKPTMSAAASTPDLSAFSVKMYAANIKRLSDAGLDPLVPEGVVAWVLANKKTENTQKNYLTSAIAWVKALPDGKEKEAALKMYREKVKELAEINLGRYMDQTLTEREAAKYLKWSEILAGVQKAYADRDCLDSDKLLMAMYTEMPPIRLDYANLEVFIDSVPEGTKTNYVVLKDSGSYVTINDYKTAKKHGPIKNALPESLTKRLKLYLAGHPEDKILFPGSSAVLGERITRLFKKYCGKAIGSSVLRHSYISDFLSRAPSYRQCEELSHKMGHTVQLQTFYRRLEKKDD
jgi:hypothetical protein